MKVGFIGWRGMVGTVLIERMIIEKDFSGYDSVFFSTSQSGKPGPEIGIETPPVQNAENISLLKKMDVLVSCQGSDYTNKIFPLLKKEGWNGYWIDAASALRMENDSVIVLDPVNRDVINSSLNKGVKKFIGGNCTVSIMLMGIGGLFNNNLLEWVSCMTYQAASGAGAKHMTELLMQMGYLYSLVSGDLANPSSKILDIDRKIIKALNSENNPTENFHAPLAGSLIPWIDKDIGNGLSKEEWKGMAETNKILDLNPPVPVDGLCVRIGAMRSHAIGLTIKLKKNVPLPDIIQIIKNSNSWVDIVPNTYEDSIKRLTPAAVSGKLTVAAGRIRKLNMGEQYISCFVVGDQLLWGAAEPIRRILKIILQYSGK